MKNKEDFIYIFVHLQKCAGTTFHRHIDKHIPVNQRLSFYDGYRTFDIPSLGWRYIENRGDIDACLSALSEEQKMRVKVIYGCDVYYGIHRYFKQTPRYISLVRNPATRVISDYNYFRKIAETALAEAGQSPSVTYRKEMHRIYDEMKGSGTPISFDAWLEKRSTPNYMVRHLIDKGFIEADVLRVARRDIGRALEKFFFIGLTDQYSTDATFLFYLLGIHYPHTNENVSQRYFEPDDKKAVERAILTRNTLDHELYEAARERNNDFKTAYGQRFRFAPLALRMTWLPVRGIAWVTAPIVGTWRTSLTALYALSARLKRRSPQYARFVHFVKGLQ